MKSRIALTGFRKPVKAKRVPPLSAFIRVHLRLTLCNLLRFSSLVNSYAGWRQPASGGGWCGFSSPQTLRLVLLQEVEDLVEADRLFRTHEGALGAGHV